MRTESFSCSTAQLTSTCAGLCLRNVISKWFTWKFCEKPISNLFVKTTEWKKWWFIGLEFESPPREYNECEIYTPTEFRVFRLWREWFGQNDSHWEQRQRNIFEHNHNQAKFIHPCLFGWCICRFRSGFVRFRLFRI